jgi:hypothetical protein
VEDPWRSGHVVLSLITAQDIRGPQLSIEPASVTAGHAASTNLSHGGL